MEGDAVCGLGATTGHEQGGSGDLLQADDDSLLTFPGLPEYHSADLSMDALDDVLFAFDHATTEAHRAFLAAQTEHGRLFAFGRLERVMRKALASQHKPLISRLMYALQQINSFEYYNIILFENANVLRSPNIFSR